MDLETIFQGKLTPAKWRMLRAYLTSQRLFPGLGTRLAKSSVGIIISAGRGSFGTNSPSQACTLKLYKFTPEGAEEPHLFVSAGVVGSVAFLVPTDMGTLALSEGKSICAVIELDGTDGTYTVTMEAFTGDPPDDTDTDFHVALGAVDGDGKITQFRCGPVNLQVCRNWYAAEAPFHGLTVLGE